MMIRRWGLRLCILVAFACVGFVGWGQFARFPGDAVSSHGKRNQAFYLTMRDGAPIAIDLWMPSNARGEARLGTVLRATRYWRGVETGWLGRSLAAFGFADPDPDAEVAALNAAGYAVLLIDARGTGASGGIRRAEWAPEETRDYLEIIEWARRQRWSNGRVAAVGLSYDANAAELIAAARPSGLRAVISVSSDFDAWAGNVRPGGVYSSFADIWAQSTGALDRNDVCAVEGVRGLRCWITRQVAPGVKPVDGAAGAAQLAAILNKRRVFDPAAGVRRTEARDMPIAAGLSLSETSPWGRLPRSQDIVPMQIWVGWLDAFTVDGALSRYATMPFGQEVWIGPWSHGIRADIDPLGAADAALSPTASQRLRETVRFLDRHMAADPLPGTRSINYQIMGGGGWRTTASWPPSASSNARLYLSSSRRLLPAPGQFMQISYRVDFEATTGTATRWHTQLGGADVRYPGGARSDDRRIVFDGAPLIRPVTIAGTPVVTLNLAISRDDGAVHAYLAAVSPSGSVHYLTEGILRLRHRATVAADQAPYLAPGPVQRDFSERRSSSVTPGSTMEIALPLAAIAARVPAGWRLRLSLAGADRPLFTRYPAKGGLAWQLSTGGEHGSTLDLPLGTADPISYPRWSKDSTS